MKVLKTKNITLMERTETEEAEEIYGYMKKTLIWWWLIPLLLFFMFSVLFVVGMISNNTLGLIMIAFMVISFFSLIIGIVVYAKLMAPYRDLLKIAKYNDRIRHDEKLRIKERERMQTAKEQYTKESIKETLKNMPYDYLDSVRKSVREQKNITSNKY